LSIPEKFLDSATEAWRKLNQKPNE